MSTLPKCGFCNRPRNEVKALYGSDPGPYICNRCVESTQKAAASASKEAAASAKDAPLPTPVEINDFLNGHVIGQPKAKVTLSVAVYNHYKRREAARRGFVMPDGVDPLKSNILVLGPSGTGKTELARALAKMLNVPFHIGDATKMTAAGYVGDDVESLLQGLLLQANGDVDRAEWGIILIDEIDKIARKSGKTPSGHKDIGGESVQQALLKLVEGSEMVISRQMGVPSGVGGPQQVINTKNILVIAAGSFAGIEDVVSARVNKSAGIGFGSTDRKRLDLADVYDLITEKDVLEFGMIPELVGRLPVMTSTKALTEDEMYRILVEPKNAIVKQMQALYAMDGIDLVFEEAALRHLSRQAMESDTGARSLRSLLEATLAPYSFQAPSEGLAALRITEDAVKGGQAIKTYRNRALGVG